MQRIAAEGSAFRNPPAENRASIPTKPLPPDPLPQRLDYVSLLTTKDTQRPAAVASASRHPPAQLGACVRSVSPFRTNPLIAALTQSMRRNGLR